MTIFWLFFGIDIIAALVILYFFFIGLGDGSISSFNAGLWFFLLAALAVVLIGGYLLKTSEKIAMANTLLAVLAIPALLALVFLLAILIFKPRWN